MIDLPVQCEMLHDAGTVAADHRIAVFHMLTSLKQHADDRRSRYRFMDFRRNARIPILIEERLIEAWTIVRIHGRDTSLNFAGHIGRRVYRQIAAFGMAADHNRPGPAAGNISHIPHSGLLRGDRTAEGHREILLPPDDRTVGATESHVQRAVAQFEDAGRELFGGFGVEFIHVFADAQVAPARALPHRTQQIDVHLRRPHLAEHVVIAFGT